VKFSKLLFLFYFISIFVSVGCKKSILASNPPEELEKRSFAYADIKSTGTFAIENALDKNMQDSLSTTLDKIWKDIPLNGISVAVGVPNRGMWIATRHTKDNSAPIDTTTLFHAESTGKMFTSVVILKLVEQGILSLDMTIDKWYSFIPRSDRITIRHLLTHTSGIPTFEAQKEYLPENYYEPIDKVKWSIKYPYLFEPGTAFSYSNTGYIILGLIAEQATGKTFANLLTEYIITPLGLKNTVPITKENRNIVISIPGHGARQIINPHEDYTGPAQAGMIASTPKDIIIFFQALMSGQLLSPQSVQEMFTDMMKFPDTQVPTFYGKGIMALPDVPPSEFPSDLFIEHNGGGPDMGFFCFPVYVPKSNVFVCVMTNDSNDNAAAIKYVLAYCVVKNLGDVN
jgi:D-alanyl-D-alanine carboxypeptidase